MKFRDDIDIDNTWVTSDNHFGHDNIVGFCHRPEDHEQVMIAEWRKEVPDDGTVLHLGDLCYRSNSRFKNLTASELTGDRKLIILGNHDKQRFSFYRDCGFRVVKPFQIAVANRYENDGRGRTLRVVPDGLPDYSTYIQFSHYPARVGELKPNDWRLHGHIHNSGYTRDAYVPFLRNHINVSVEQTKYKPVNLGMLLRGVLLGDYPETTQEQLDNARDRKKEAMK